MRRMIAVIGLLLALGGCGLPKAPADVETAARAAYFKLAAGDAAGLKAISGPELRAQETPDLLEQMRAQIPNEKLSRDQTFFWQVTASTGAPTQADVKRLYSYPSGDVLFDVVLEKPASGGGWVMVGMHILPAAPGASSVNDFTLEGKSPLQYAVLAGAILSPLICIFAFVQVLRAPKFRWKWAFAILSLLAFGQFAINWTTGAGTFQPANIALLGAGFIKGGSPLDPWVLSFNLPIGAAIGLWRAGKARREKTAAATGAFQ